MPKTSKAKLEYMAEYQKSPKEVKKREMRNLARAHALKEGVVHKGDGKEIDHKKMLDAGGSNSKGNLRVVDASTNRGWRKDHKKAYGK